MDVNHQKIYVMGLQKRIEGDEREIQRLLNLHPIDIIDYAKQLYWLEDKKSHAIQILRCFADITFDQMNNILNSNATIDNDFMYVEF